MRGHLGNTAEDRERELNRCSAGGGIIGAIAGNAGMGAAIGAGVGGAGGFLYGKHKEGEQEAYQRGVTDGRQSR